jgi:hypothetical protein
MTATAPVKARCPERQRGPTVNQVRNCCAGSSPARATQSRGH